MPVPGARPGASVVIVIVTETAGPEEVNSLMPHLGADDSEYVRGDIVFFETANAGAVFSMSSISWAGSLCHNNYDNNVSRITENVLRRFLDEAPFR